MEEWIKEQANPQITKIISLQKFQAIKNIVYFYRILSYYTGQTIHNLREYFLLLLAYVKHFVSHITEDQYLNFSTVHSAKGSEFEYVFILNLVEGKFPKHYAETTQDIEEERRILFVGMTRAKKELYLVSDLFSSKKRLGNNMTRSLYLNYSPPTVSKFLRELNFLSPNNSEIKILDNLSEESKELYFF